MVLSGTLSQYIEQNTIFYAKQIFDLMLRTEPRLEKLYSQHHRIVLTDFRYHLEHLAQAIRFHSPVLYHDYLIWNRNFFPATKVPIEDIVLSLRTMHSFLSDLPVPQDERTTLDACFSSLGDIFSSPPMSETEVGLKGIARDFFDRVLDNDIRGAGRVIGEAMSPPLGFGVEDVFLNIIQPCLHHVGYLWQTGSIGIGDEHSFTTMTEKLMASVSLLKPPTQQENHMLMASCIGDERHNIGIRMVSDFFYINGWNTVSYGGDMPMEALLKGIRRYNPQVLALSATMVPHLSRVRDLVRILRNDIRYDNLKILVGGRPFNIDHDLWRKVEADGSGTNAREALFIANSLL